MKQKTIQDYYEDMYKEFPGVPKSDIKRILQYGWKQLYLHNSYGCDVSLQRNSFWFYCGKLMKNSLNHFQYYTRKLKTKLRILYKRNGVEWDGYYYFSRNAFQYAKYLSQKNSKGRPKKYFIFNNVFLKKIKDECILTDYGSVALFRIPYVEDFGFSAFKRILKTDKAELIEITNPLKMKDILTSNRTYELIKNKKYK